VETLFIDEVIKLSLEKFLGTSATSQDIEKIKSLYNYQKGKEVKFKNKFSAVRERNNIVLRKFNTVDIKERKIKAGQSVRVNDKWLSFEVVKNSRFIMSQPGCEFISINVEHPTFTVRPWRDGDKFKPLGMKNFKKVSDFLTDLKIPASQKKEQQVLTYRNQIIWVVGLRIDDRYKITSQTKRAVKLCLK
jgi:tRNA(Ile)-lysidine synthase